MPNRDKDTRLWDPAEEFVVKQTESLDVVGQRSNTPPINLNLTLHQQPDRVLQTERAPRQRPRTLVRGLGWTVSVLLIGSGVWMVNKRESISEYFEERSARQEETVSQSGSTVGDGVTVEVVDGQDVVTGPLPEVCARSSFKYKNDVYEACFNADSFEEIDGELTALPNFEPIGYSASNSEPLVNFSKALEIIVEKSGVEACENELVRFQNAIVDNRSEFGAELNVDLPASASDIVILSRVPQSATDKIAVEC